MLDCGMIRFECSSCGVRIRVPDEHAGKHGNCPKCRQRVQIPAQQDTQDDPLLLEPLDIPAAPVDSPLQDAINGPEDVDDTPAGQRRFPWPIDILLYPMNSAGFIHLAIFVGIPLLIGVIQYLLGPVAGIFWIVYVAVRIAVGLYYCWYITECVNDSSTGGTRAPDAFSSATVSEQFSLVVHLSATYVVFVGPAGFYNLYLHRTDLLFWCLAGYGAVFFPMGLLAMIMYQDSSALNPFKLLLAIAKTLLPYAGLVVLLAGVFGLFMLLSHIPILGEILWVYGTFVLAHLLGRFYWRNEERIGWF